MSHGQISDEDLLYLLTDLHPGQTGLPFIVYVSAYDDGQPVQIWVALRRKMVPSEMARVTVEPPIMEIGGEKQLSEDQLNILRRWIELNRNAIVKTWTGEIGDSVDVMAAIRSI
jgi:hypothetical protein